MFKEKFRKIDFLIPLIIGFLLAWWSFGRGEYFGVAIFLIFSLVGANARWKLGHGTEEYRKKCKEEALKIVPNIRKVSKAIILPPLVIMILMILFGILLNLSRQEYLMSLILSGAELFFAIIFLFEIRNHQNIKQTIILLGVVVIYAAILLLIFYK